MSREKIDIVELFKSEKLKNKYLTVGAPMVRYSKLEFRTLLRRYNVQLCFTPMIIADSFCKSQNARTNEFTTTSYDNPLIVQFAAKNSFDMLTACQMIYPYVDGVDLNCGCPQSWAIAKGYGCALLKQPELLKDISQTLQRNFDSKFSFSVKIRLLQNNIKSTIELCRTLEKCGVNFITVHGRTPWQKTSEPLNTIAIGEIKRSTQIPIIANGNVRTLEDANRLYMDTGGCDGIMSARGLLSNPTLFTGSNITTTECIQNWLNLATEADNRITFQCFHHHLTFMMEKLLPRKLRVIFNNFTKKQQILEFLSEHCNIQPSSTSHNCLGTSTLCKYDESFYQNKNDQDLSNWSNITNKGKYFTDFAKTHANCYLDSYDDGNNEVEPFFGSWIFNT